MSKPTHPLEPCPAPRNELLTQRLPFLRFGAGSRARPGRLLSRTPTSSLPLHTHRRTYLPQAGAEVNGTSQELSRSRRQAALARARLITASAQALAPALSSLRQQERIICRQVSCAALALVLPKPPQRAQEPTSSTAAEGTSATGDRLRRQVSAVARSPPHSLFNNDPQIGPQTLPAGSPWFGWSPRVPNAGDQHLFAAFNAV